MTAKRDMVGKYRNQFSDRPCRQNLAQADRIEDALH